MNKDEIRKLRVIHTDDFAFAQAIERLAYRAGQESMRERAAKIVENPHWKTVVRNELRIRASHIRSLPIE